MLAQILADASLALVQLLARNKTRGYADEAKQTIGQQINRE